MYKPLYYLDNQGCETCQGFEVSGSLLTPKDLL